MELAALLDDVHVGVLWSDRGGNPQFKYSDVWRENLDAIPLSLSLPISASTHATAGVSSVLWGLLPDNEHTLERWAKKFQVSARDPVAILAQVGEDCAGAIQFVQFERLEDRRSGKLDSVEWLDEKSIAARLGRLRQDSGAARDPGDVGQFSLAGAQPKTALLFQDGRWGIPQGRIPTSHILKPPGGEYEGYAQNEHFCQCLAKLLGLPAASSTVQWFDDEVAICVERYDRVFANGHLFRIHQEDCCQALGISPQHKYQNEHGPSPRDIAELLWTHSSRPREDVEALFRALAFNWFIAGTDAHAKNYSLLLGPRGDVRLAPLYDLSSVLPYPRLDKRKIKMAMKIGGHYRWWEITSKDWLTLAADLRLEAEYAFLELLTMASALPDMASALALTMAGNGVGHPVTSTLVTEIATAAQRCVHLIGNTA